MSLDDLRLRETVDLAERVDTIREEFVPDLEERIPDAEEQEEKAKNDEDADDPPESPEELRGLKDRLEGQATACERVVDALDGDGRFTLQELMTAEVSMLTDDVSEHSFEMDYDTGEAEGVPNQGYHRIRTLELSIVEAPDGVDTTHDRDLGREVYKVGMLPDLVGEYLFNCATALNDVGDVEDVQDLSHYGVTSTSET